MDVMPVTPLTSVKVIRNVPFDNTYKDVLDFSDTSSQISYFTSKAKETFTNMVPVNISKNAISIKRPADYFFDCNYIMFQNKNFNTKWFYAFITDIEFVNVNMCIIHFELDVYQTWMFDITIKQSFVEREHTNDDTIGVNLVTEDVDLGYYREEKAKFPPFFNSYKAVVASSWDGDNDTGGNIGGLVTGLSYFGFDVSTPSDILKFKEMLKLFVDSGKSDSIASIFMMPSEFFTTTFSPKRLEYEVPKSITSIGSYIPKNKKLLTYPYNFLYSFTDEGSESIYRYEFFNGDSCFFELSCGMSCNPQILLTPANYQNQVVNINESMTLSGFPQVAWTIDTFRAWLAQESAGTGLQLIGSLAGITSNPLLGTLGATSAINGVIQASMRPPTTKGSQGNSTTTATKNKGFYFVNKHISEEYAKIIDDYFSMFGYATNQVKMPNIKGRPSWNYVKTKDVKIIGSIPFNDIRKIKDIYNNGVTIWHGDYVGDYSRNNQV